uniref:Putative ovule protein n=1 Tax=Solanum chacoense TaxID=4108 RepID=A0A0V0GSB1_SOLCH
MNIGWFKGRRVHFFSVSCLWSSSRTACKWKRFYASFFFKTCSQVRGLSETNLFRLYFTLRIDSITKKKPSLINSSSFS